MNTITSAEFRKTYPRLTEGTTVEANGRYIGTWLPAVIVRPEDITETPLGRLPKELRRLTEVEGTVEPTGQPARPLTQAERDAILRRVNKGG